MNMERRGTELWYRADGAMRERMAAMAGRLIWLVLVVGTVSACSAEAAPCPEPIGTWVIRATQTSGTCGDLPAETGPFLGTAPAGSMPFLGARGSSCAGEWTATDSTMCVYHLARACP